MAERYRFDRPSPDGPAWVYAGERLVAMVQGGNLATLWPLKAGAAAQIMDQFAAWQPTPFWLSWVHNIASGDRFVIRWPCWYIPFGDLDNYDRNVYAAVRAASPEEAKEAIMASYDERPERLAFRFCHSRPEDWSPFSERFPKAPWMEW